MKKNPLSKSTLFTKTPRVIFVFVFLIAIAGFTCLPKSVDASSTISQYAQKELPFKPNDLETGFYEKLKNFASARDYKIELDPHLSIAAIMYSKEIAEAKSIMNAALLSYCQMQAGSIEANVFPYILEFSQEKQFSKFLPDIYKTFSEQQASHCGFGFSYNKKENTYVLIILGAQKNIDLNPFPKHLSTPGSKTIQGTLKNSFKNIKILVNAPNNIIINSKASIQGEAFTATIPFDQGKGAYIIEIVGENNSGPQVLALFPVYVQAPPPNKVHQLIINDPQNFNNSFAAEKYMLSLINKEREKSNLPILEYSAKISDIARAHSKEMIASKYFAHISPIDGTDVGQRISNNSDIAVTLVGENIAINETITGGHLELLKSPAHRAAILHPNFTGIGLGIETKIDPQGKKLYYITQNFFSQIKDIDIQSFTNYILQKLNEKRKELNLSELIIDKNSSALASAHSQTMAAGDTLSFDAGNQNIFEKIKASSIPYTYLSANIYAYNDPSYIKYVNSPELHEKRFTKIGVGIIQNNSAQFGKKTIWLTLIFLE